MTELVHSLAQKFSGLDLPGTVAMSALGCLAHRLLEDGCLIISDRVPLDQRETTIAALTCMNAVWDAVQSGNLEAMGEATGALLDVSERLVRHD